MGATSTGIETGDPRTVVSVVTDVDVDENPRSQAEAGERLAIPVERALVAGAADDVAPRLGSDDRLGEPLRVVEGEQLVHSSRAYRLALREFSSA